MGTLSTPLCERLGIDVPIVQAPIGSVSTPALAAAVSNAGGLGTLAVTWRDPETTRKLLATTRDRTDRPVAANVVLDRSTTVYSPADHVEACLAAGVDVLSFSFGDAAAHASTVHEAGGTVIWMVGSVDQARRAISGGADVLVAQGQEAGGHLQGRVSTWALVPAVADLAQDTDIPVVAAGGIGDGRGIAAALALGADGAWLGTRFVATNEAGAHHRYQNRILGSSAEETCRSTLFDGGWPGRPHRTLRTETVETWIDAGRPSPGSRPGEDEVVATGPNGAPIERYDDDPPLSETDGSVSALPMYAGESVGQVDEIKPAATVVADLIAETCHQLDEGIDASPL